MCKKLIYLIFFTSVLGLAEGQALGDEWDRAAYWDARYPSAWGGGGEGMRDALEGAGYRILDADQLKTWMNARIADRKLSVVVFCRDVAPDTVVESMSSSCTLRRYLNAGGKIVWYADIPFYYQGHSNGPSTIWENDGSIAVLGFDAASAPWDTNDQVVFTDAGVVWGLTQTWISQRPADLNVYDELTVLATDAGGNAAAWVKHYVEGDNYRGFVRIWDQGGEPSLDDLRRVAEYNARKAVAPQPSNGAIYEDTWISLSWSPGELAVSHDVYFGDNFDDVNDGTGDAFQGNQAATNIIVGFPGFPYPDGLVPGTTYYWRVDGVNDADPNSPWKGDVWSFFVPPKKAYEPDPAVGMKFVDPDVTLSWTGGFGAKLHTIYFGDNFYTVNNAAGELPQENTTYTPGPLELEKTYYWRVDEFDAITTHKGDVWSFTTANFLVVDDFEDYDAGDNQIWYAWHDGFGYGAPDTDPYYPGNGTGSVVGDKSTASYTEESIVHGGSQSMPLFYDNNKQGFFKYSEAELTLKYPRDWTEISAAELSLWYHGRPASVGNVSIDEATGTYTVNGVGVDIWDSADEFRYAYTQLYGDGSIVARVVSVQNTNGWAKAGVMIRETLDPDSKHALCCITPGNGKSFQNRRETGQRSWNSNTGGVQAPYWVRLVRQGNLFSAYHSPDGATWTLQEASSETSNPEAISMPPNVYIGLALTSHNPDAVCEAVFDNVVITGEIGPDVTSQDIGIASNDPEPMYVALNGSVVVYHNNPNAALIDDWTEWNIDLQVFADQGVNLANVNTFALGFGDRNNPLAGGSGTVYFDDIRLREADTPPVIEFVVTSSAGPNGSISPAGDTTVSLGDNLRFTATPTPGTRYQVDRWSVDGIPVQTGGTTYTLSNIQEDHEVRVTFKLHTYVVRTTAGANGSINPIGDTTVDHGYNLRFTTSPGIGYLVDKWSVDGDEVQAGGTTYTLSNIQEDHEVRVTFKLRTYVVRTTAGANGSINPIGDTTVDHGYNLRFTASPGIVYQVDKWSVDGDEVQTGGATYTLSNIQEDHEVRVTFKLRTYVVRTTAGANGSINPIGDTTVDHGYNLRFTASPGIVYQVDKWSVDGDEVQTGGTTYTLSNIQAHYEVRVTFKLRTYVVRTTAGANGSINPIGDTTVDHSYNLRFTASPGIGYLVDKWSVDGEEVQTGGTTYTLSDIQEDHTVHVTFSRIPPTAKGILIEYWFGGAINYNLDTLKAHSDFPNYSHASEWLQSLERPDLAWTNYFGALARGFLIPPETGVYTFWIASDDDGELHLSSDEDPANMTMVASVKGKTSVNEWEKYGTQKSEPISLDAGQRYYIEVQFSDGTGSSHMSVAWAGPHIGEGPVAIDGEYLTPFIRESEPLLKAKKPIPADGKLYMDTRASLSWSAGETAVSHDVYFDDIFDDVNNGTDDTFRGNQPSTDFDPDGLVPGTTYYWRIDEVEADGTTHKGNIWSFSIPPMTAYDPDPADADGARFVDPSVTLNWMAGMGAILHTVYFGDDFDTVNNATEGIPQETTSYTPGLLELDKTYYWRIDEFDGVATHEGNVWSFTTDNPRIEVVDDFDIYGKNVGERVIDFWIDGGGWPSRPPAEDPLIPSNDTGAIVGHDIWTPGTPYTTLMETTIVRNDNQSMPLYYNNWDWPFYSQADLPSEKPQNWKAKGENALTLYVHGQLPKYRETPTGGFVLSGAGADIWGTSDEFRYLYKPLNGNGSITARVVSNGTGSNAWAMGGVMIRQGLDTGSTHAMMVLTGGDGGGAAFQWRPFANADSQSAHNPTPDVSPPYWVRIERKGNTLKGYLSPDGVNWKQQGQAATIDMWGAAVFIGLCVTSHASGELRTYEFDNISTTGAVLGQWQIEDVGVVQPGNDPAPMYIAVEDIAGNVGVVYHPDPMATLTTYWQRWTIPFSEFESAGVNLTEVNIFSIGVGMYPNPGSFMMLSNNGGGQGMVYCEDPATGIAGPSPGKLCGFIRNILTGAPIPHDPNDPDVTLTPETGTGELSDDFFFLSTFDDGEYMILITTIAPYYIKVTAEGYNEDGPDVYLSTCDITTMRDFLLEPNQEPDPLLSCPSPIYRFSLAEPHDLWYFTANDEEKETLLYDVPENGKDKRDPNNWTYDGIAFCARDHESDPNLKPVHHFRYKEKKNHHLYTINENEKKYIIDECSVAWTYVGEAFYAYSPYYDEEASDADTPFPEGKLYPEDEEPDGTKPVYHLLHEDLDCHFYTILEDEKEWAEKHGWTYQEVAWYAFGVGP